MRKPQQVAPHDASTEEMGQGYRSRPQPPVDPARPQELQPATGSLLHSASLPVVEAKMSTETIVEVMSTPGTSEAFVQDELTEEERRRRKKAELMGVSPAMMARDGTDGKRGSEGSDMTAAPPEEPIEFDGLTAAKYAHKWTTAISTQRRKPVHQCRELINLRDIISSLAAAEKMSRSTSKSEGGKRVASLATPCLGLLCPSGGGKGGAPAAKKEARQIGPADPAVQVFVHLLKAASSVAPYAAPLFVRMIATAQASTARIACCSACCIPYP